MAKIQKIIKNHAFIMKLSMNFLFLLYTCTTIIITQQSMEGISFNFYYFKALNNNLEA